MTFLSSEIGRLRTQIATLADALAAEKERAEKAEDGWAKSRDDCRKAAIAMEGYIKQRKAAEARLAALVAAAGPFIEALKKLEAHPDCVVPLADNVNYDHVRALRTAAHGAGGEGKDV